ncbi:hypothetical protein Vafri_21145 [Volvox africanus]|uniref:Protein SYS1 homolog n=1 Tax=Volvox africanus TaxID=51714 RepID=A0A8J4BV70_9CHLO|nr:hypothetical protein Vafri_21145 [Volvox africanus]
MLYGAAVWDPVLIIAQIATIQCLFYLSLGLWQGILLGPNVAHLSIQHLFSWRAYSLANYVGYISAMSLLVTSVLGAVFLMWIVERAKKCLDFASTCFMFHFFFCWHYEGFPTRFEWWLVNGMGLIIMSLFGEWLCLRREMQEIPLSELSGTDGVAIPLQVSHSGVAGASTTTATLLSAITHSIGSSSRYRDSRLLRPFGALHTVLKRYVERARS